MSRWLPWFCVALLVGCSSESTAPTPTDAGSDAGKSCVEGGKTYAAGTSWTCSDGCNHCTCLDGLVSSTTKACGCADKTGFHMRGESWTCPDGCNTCTCNDDFTIGTTLIACDGDAGDATPD